VSRDGVGECVRPEANIGVGHDDRHLIVAHEQQSPTGHDMRVDANRTTQVASLNEEQRVLITGEGRQRRAQRRCRFTWISCVDYRHVAGLGLAQRSAEDVVGVFQRRKLMWCDAATQSVRKIREILRQHRPAAVPTKQQVETISPFGHLSHLEQRP
jgi:hypothetical protein